MFSVRMTELGRYGNFALTVLLNAAVSMASIPVLVSTVGAVAWGAMAVGQSAGTIAGVVGSLGWGFSGPNAVARASGEGRAYIVRESIVARIGSTPLVALAAAVIAGFAAPSEIVLASATAFATAFGATSFAWYFIGVGSSRGLLLLDTLPRVLLVGTGLLMTKLAGNPGWFIAAQLVAFLIAASASGTWILRSLPPVAGAWSISRSARAVRLQASASLTVVISSIYMSVPVLVVAWLAPAALPSYAMADRLAKFALTATAPVQQVMQSWVPSASSAASLQRRMRRAVAFAAVTGLGLFVILGIGGGALSSLLSHGEVRPEAGILLLAGAAVLFSSISRVVGSACLLTLDGGWVVAISATVGAICGVIMLVAFTPLYAGVGAALAYAGAELLVLVIQVSYLVRRWPNEYKSAIFAGA